MMAIYKLAQLGQLQSNISTPCHLCIHEHLKPVKRVRPSDMLIHERENCTNIRQKSKAQAAFLPISSAPVIPRAQQLAGSRIITYITNAKSNPPITTINLPPSLRWTHSGTSQLYFELSFQCITSSTNVCLFKQRPAWDKLPDPYPDYRYSNLPH